MIQDGNDVADSIYERFMRLLKIGEVSSINPAACTARVVFDDEDSRVSYDLEVIQRNTFENQDYYMPSIGESVLCAFINGDDNGFILGSWYADEITPPAASENIRMVKFKDGTVFRYDMESRTLDVIIDGTSIKADTSTVDVAGADTVNISGGTQVNITGGASINLVAPVVTLTMGGTTMTLNSGNAVIDTENITFTGDMTVTGDAKINGNTTIDGTLTTTGNIAAPNV